MFTFAILGALLALSAGQPLTPRYSPFQSSYNYNGQFYNPADPFVQYPVIALVNNQNQPLGYVYSVI